MFELGRISRVAFTVALALTTLGTDALVGQGRQASTTRRTVILEGREVVEGEVLVRYRPGIGRLERERAEFYANSRGSEIIGTRGARRMRSVGATTRAMLQALRNNPDVEFAEPNYVIRATALPNDPSMGELWGLLNTGQTVEGRPGQPGADIRAVEAWDLTTGSRSSIVAVVDTGIDFTHPDLAANRFSAPREFSVSVGSITVTCAAGTHGFNALNNTCLPFDDNGHGTHVAGIIGAVGNNNVGVTGVNWTASMMAVKVLDAAGAGTTADAIKAIEFTRKAKIALGADANVRVLNASWGGGGFSQLLADEIEAANAANMLFVATAGSDGTNIDAVPHYPASLPGSNIISVAAVDNTGEMAAFSNYGATSVDLAAPGAETLSTTPGNNYGYLSGTSMAASFVSGAAALVLSQCTGYSSAQLKNALLSTVRPVASLQGVTVSGGRLDVNAAVRSCGPPTLTVNGQAGPVTVAPGSTVTVHVANGPGFRSDYVLMVPAGSPPQTWGDYLYLSGTRTRPATGMTSATVSFVAPSASGNYEFRFFQNDTFTLLATSAVVTVGGPSNPAPALSSLSPTSRTAGGAAFTLTVTGSGFVSASQVRINGSARTTSFVSSTTLTAAIPASDIASQGSLAVTVFSPTPGGGTSSALTLAVNASSPAPTLRVNGGSSAITVAGGSTITVGVSNGPGYVSDFVLMVPAGSPPQTWGDYKYLSNTRTRPSTGMTSATLTFVAPSGGGNFEFRFYQNDTFTLLATSPVVTVTASASSNPVPSISALSPSSATAGGAAFTLTVTGTGFVSGSEVRVNGSPRSTTFVSSTSLTAAIPASDIANQGSLAITVFTPAPGGGTSSAINLAVNAPPSTAPTLRVNGGSSAITVAGGSTITVGVSNGPGYVSDFVLMVPAGSPPQTWGDYKYLSNTRTRPSTGMTSATLTFVAPSGGGNFEFRFYQNDTFTLLATSPVVTVTASASSNPVPSISSVSPNSATAGGAAFTMTVTGTGFVSGSQVRVNGSARSTTFVSSTSLTASIPATDIANQGSLAITVFTPAPGGGTSGAVSFAVNAQTSTSTSLRVNGSSAPVTVAGGSTITVGVSNGPGYVSDYVLMVAAGSPPQTWGDYKYLSNSRTRPSTGMTSATLTFVAPTGGGSFEFRFYQNDTFTLLATSPVVTVTGAASPSLAINGGSGPITVAGGSTITVNVSNGPGFVADYVLMVPAGSPAGTWGDYKYLSNTRTRPSSGMTSAVLTFVAPAAGGNFEFRFYQNDSWTLLATSSVVTVTP